MTTRELGRAGERAAGEYMEQHGFHVLCRNYIAGHCEIDIIAETERAIVFTEVKLRRDGAEYARDWGRPAAAVTKAKQAHLISAAKAYLKEHPTGKVPHMDVCEVWWTPMPDGAVSFRFHYIERAFGAQRPKEEYDS